MVKKKESVKGNSESVKDIREKIFHETLEKINKEINSDTGRVISLLSDKPLDVESVSSGSLVLDSLLGGGIPKGRIVEIYGPEASGKTSIALTTVGNVQRNGGNAVLIDLENAFDPKYAAKLGVDVKNLAVSQPDYAEQAFSIIQRLVDSNAVDIIVVDSIAAMSPKAEFENEMDKDTVGLVARLMSKALRKLIKPINDSKTIVIFINQTRDAIGGYVPMKTTTGGNAMKFYASQRISISKQSKPVVDEDKKPIGVEVKIKIVKNKIAPPFGEGSTILTFNKGINRAAELLEVGLDKGLIDRRGSSYYIADTENRIAVGKSAAVKELENDEGLYASLSERLAGIIFQEVNHVSAESLESLDEVC